MKIQNGEVVCLEHRKAAVKDLLLSVAFNRGVIQYPTMYGLFVGDKSSGVDEGTWKACVWQTVETVSQEIATLEGAIYFGLMSDTFGVPKDSFWFPCVFHRKDEYEASTNTALPGYRELSLEQKLSLVAFERERIYRHVRKYYIRQGNTWHCTKSDT